MSYIKTQQNHGVYIQYKYIVNYIIFILYTSEIIYSYEIFATLATLIVFLHQYAKKSVAIACYTFATLLLHFYFAVIFHNLVRPDGISSTLSEDISSSRACLTSSLFT